MVENVFNELDTVHFGIPLNECSVTDFTPKWNKILGAEYKITPSYIIFNISSKLFAAENTIGAITLANVEEIPKILNQNFGFDIDPQYLLEDVSLWRVDVKKDIITKELPNYYISDLRRYLKRATKKYNVVNHDEMIYSNGFSITPKLKSKHRLTIYNKGLDVSMSKNKELRGKLNYETLANLDKTFRCEVQLSDFKNIKKAFHLPDNEVQTFRSVLACKEDVVYECFSKLMKGETAV